MLRDSECKFAYFAGIQCPSGLLVHTVKLNQAKKPDTEHCSVRSLTTYIHFNNCTTANKRQGYN